MIKTNSFSFLKLNKFEFGEQIVSQFVIIECKWLFSIIIFYFHKSNSSQDRFHTHAFNAFSIKLFGEYDEHILENEYSGDFSVKKRNYTFAYFPRNSYHRIANSKGCCTVLFSGSWKPTWKERLDNGEIIEYFWNRKTK